MLTKLANRSLCFLPTFNVFSFHNNTLY